MKDNKDDKIYNKAREIEFRGKRKIDNTWIYGGYMKTARTNKIQVGGTSRFCTVYPETLGQFTGKRDKSGNKIFEGDILLVVPKERSIDGKDHYDYVIFSNGCFCLANAVMFYEFTYGVGNYEVVGNIHDNSELLGGSDEECDN